MFEPIRLRALVVPVVLVLGTLAIEPVHAVSDDAVLYIGSLNARSFTGGFHGENASPAEFELWITPIDDAPPGNTTANIKVEVSHYNGTGTVQEFQQSWTVLVPEEGSYQAYQPLKINWDAPAGMFLVIATLMPLDDPNHVWDTKTTSFRSGSSPNLQSGWGHRTYAGVADIDLDDDGAIDLTLRNNETGLPIQWDVDARTGTGFTPTQQPYRALWLKGLATGNSPRPGTDGSLSEGLIRRMLDIGPEQQIEVQTCPCGPPVDGQYRFNVPASDSTSRFELGFHFLGAPPTRAPVPAGGWADGFHTYFNLTYWQMDGDATNDLTFYDSTARTAEDARAQSEDERRGAAIRLIGRAQVEHRETRRTLTLDFERTDSAHTAAWVEIQNASAMFRHMLDRNASESNTTLHYEYSLSNDEAFSQEQGNRTWIWIGHFSVQTVRVVLDYLPQAQSDDAAKHDPEHDAKLPDAEAKETERSHGWKETIPTTGVAPALMLLALCVALRRRRQ